MIGAIVLAGVVSCGSGGNGGDPAQAQPRFWYCVTRPELAVPDAARDLSDRLMTTCFRDRGACEHFVKSGGTCLVATVAWCTTTSGPICVADKTFCDSVSSQNHGTPCAMTAP
jgi:hypothetical protein